MDLKQLVKGKSGEKFFLLGNEAAVRGAIESGVSIASTYPGTPSSEIGNILSLIAKDAGIYFEFSINEKVAIEVASSSAASGLRSFAFMKHVGLNVASDSFVSAVYTGVRGGMVVLTADDPSIFSSQNEQDNRHYARLANLPVLEPSNPQEVKDMMKYAYKLSEEFEIPVLLRTTTRVSHMRGIVELGEISSNNHSNDQKHWNKDHADYSNNNQPHWNKGYFKKNPKQFVPVPDNALTMHKKLVSKMKNIEKVANESDLNEICRFNQNNNLKFGVIASGSAFNYAYDIINEDNLEMDILKCGFSHPFPKNKIFDFIKDLDGVFVVEEVDPIMEKEILAILGENGMNIPVFGKLNGIFPLIYEFTPDIVRSSFNKVSHEFTPDIDENSFNKALKNVKDINQPLNNEIANLTDELPNRPPTLCAGCSHRSTYFGVKKAAKELEIAEEDLIFSSDIGCYTLGVSPPYKTADYLLSMGASIGNACGFSASTNQKIVSFIGDSTFFHGGIPPLINAVHNKHKFVVTVLDNRTTAMTGGQPNPGLPVDGMGDIAPEISIEKIAIASGCEFVETINPLNLKKTIDTYKRALEFDGVAVIIAKYPCTLIKGQKKKKPMEINHDKCNQCLDCVTTLACPAISLKEEHVIIDDGVCKGCTTCVQMCNEKAIGIKK
ncbi:MAG: indolepyruvate ferredoxin oxidoreductase subunit alpha [Methanobacteriaceae archaeon]|jgi:indolepyruvate ferredoxin oxidoreductase alpha subunit|nr:indolepyruvate ferredoxin oxidoreductase subunit alpha [Candidatus Methanorudis spinitermitis]